jgi:SRSO17 transposase
VAAAARIGAGLGRQKRAELLGLLRGCFSRVEPWLQAGKYIAAVVGGGARRNGWAIAGYAGDRSPRRTQRLLNRAAWDAFAAMSVVRRFVVAGLDEAAGRCGRRGGLAVGAIDETSQAKQGSATAGVKRHYLGCVGKVSNGITTVHLAYVRERAGHALIGARQWIPEEHISDPVRSVVMGLPGDLVFRTKGQLAVDVLTEALADGAAFDFVCGDEVYGSCTELREFCEDLGQGYVLRVPSSFGLTLAAGTTMTCGQAVTGLLAGARRWVVRSAGAGSKGQRWYAWAWLATASPRHHLLVRRHLSSGELAFHFCHVPEGQLVSKARLIRAAGLRWPVERNVQIRQGLLRPRPVPGPPLPRDRPPHRPGHGRISDLRRHRRLTTRSHRYPGTAAGQARSAASRRPGVIPLTIPELSRLLATPPARRPGHAEHWANWRRRH